MLGEFGEISDQKRGFHFSGGSGQELRRMCTEAGFNFYDCHHDMVFSIPGLKYFVPSYFCQDWSKAHPFVKPRFEGHVAYVKQAIYDSDCTVVAALGDLALFILTGEKSVAKWRGSCMYTTINERRIKVIPTYAPSRILKVWDWRHISMYDLRRINEESKSKEYSPPDSVYHIRPTYAEAEEYLLDAIAACDMGESIVSHDLETINRYISCSGLAMSRTEAMCIPFMTREEDTPETPHAYWSKRQETKLVKLHSDLLVHRNALVVGQNYLYDCQHVAHSWGVYPNVWMDTMLAWHTMFPGEKKSLDFLASIFCDHYTYWKDELKDYNRYPADEEQYWNYNCKDVCYTYEIAEKLPPLVELAEQVPQYTFQMDMYAPVFRVMLRGVRIDTKLRAQLSHDLLYVAQQLEHSLLTMSGNFKPEGSTAITHWFNSPKQCLAFFYDYLGLPKQINRATKKPSTDDAALTKLAEEEPLVAPIVQKIQELRSVNIFRKNFIEAPLGSDKRIRCSYNLAGTATFRLASSKDAFGQGANLQTIPSGNE